jgi:hypothetical protein
VPNSHLVGVEGHATAGQELHYEGVGQLLPAVNFTVQHPAQRVALQQQMSVSADMSADGGQRNGAMLFKRHTGTVFVE